MHAKIFEVAINGKKKTTKNQANKQAEKKHDPKLGLSL